MSVEKTGGCLPIMVIVAVVVSISFMCNHVEEETSKLDSFTSIFYGIIIFTLVVMVVGKRK